MGISWSQKRADNLRSSKLSLHVSIDASKPEILASERYRAFFWGHPVLRTFEILEDNLGMVLPDEEKLEFVKTLVLWIQKKDNIDSCFILNLGFDPPLPWPQVLSRYI